MSPDSVLDATIFKKQEGIEFPGEHVAFLRTMCKDQLAVERFFLSVQQLFREDIESRLAGRKKGPITIVIFSDLGKHRSRALARFLAYIYESKRYNFRVDEPIHLHSKGCGRFHCPHGCMWPGGWPTKEKKLLCEEVLNSYTDLQDLLRKLRR